MHFLSDDQSWKFKQAQSYVQLLKNRKWTIFLMTAVFFASGLFFYFQSFYYYESSCMVTQEGLKISSSGKIATGNDFLSIQDDGKDFRRLIQIAQSDTLAQLLNRDFRLAEHYGIPTNAAHLDQKLLRRLRKNLIITKNANDQIVVSFRDARDPELAAAIANQIPVYLERVNREMLRREIQDYADALRDNYAAAEKKSQELELTLTRLLDQLKSVDRQQQDPERARLYLQAGQAMSSLDLSLNRTYQEFQNYYLALGISQNDRLPTIQFRRKAIPDDSNLVMTGTLMSIGILVLSFALASLTLLSGNQMLRKA